MPLNNYQNVVQTSVNSCGAFALAAALTEVNPNGLINGLDVNNLGNGYSLFNPEPFAQCLYQFTGNLSLNFLTGQATYQYQSPAADMNSPSAIVTSAINFGVAANQIRVLYTTDGNNLFGAITVTNNGAGANLLQTETTLLAQANVNVVGPTPYVLPVNNQVHLLVVNNGTHWIALTKNAVYDPATGFVGAYQSAANPVTITYQNGGLVTVCNFTGIWIEFA
jgi:hypothetical protein